MPCTNIINALTARRSALRLYSFLLLDVHNKRTGEEEKKQHSIPLLCIRMACNSSLHHQTMLPIHPSPVSPHIDAKLQRIALYILL
jgi:hypothetical protein